MTKRLNIKYSRSSSSLSKGIAEGYSYYIKRYASLLRSGNIYRYIGNDEELDIVHKKIKKETKEYAPRNDDTIMVKLGGVFEEIGGKDEAIGGGSQEVG